MIKPLLQVAAFMRTFQQPVRLSPIDEISFKEYDLRRELTKEETREFFEDAFLNQGQLDDLKVDQCLALDGLCDRLYVFLGDVHTLGFGFILPVAFRRVHESNMSKLWTWKEVAMAEETTTNLTFDFVGKGDPIKVADNERCYLARNQIGKIIKSPSYEPAALQDLLDDLHGQEIMSFDRATEIIYGDAEEPSVDELLEEFGKDSEDEID